MTTTDRAVRDQLRAKRNPGGPVSRCPLPPWLVCDYTSCEMCRDAHTDPRTPTSTPPETEESKS